MIDTETVAVAVGQTIAVGLPAIVNMRDLVAAPPVMSEEIVFGLLRKRHKMIIAGPSKAGKSFLAICLALCLATGRAFLSFPCRQSRVLFVNFEIDGASFYYRVRAVADALGIDPALENFGILNLRGRNLCIEELSALLIEAARGYDVIICDPFYKMLRSNAIREVSENSSATMSVILDELDRVAETLGASVIIVDHYSKGAQGSKAAIDRAAGSGAKGRDCDAMLAVSELEVIESNAFRVEFILREFASPKPIDIRWEYPLHHLTQDLGHLSVRGTVGRRRAVDETEFKAAVEGGEKNVKTLAQRFKVSERTIKNYLATLEGF